MKLVYQLQYHGSSKTNVYHCFKCDFTNSKMTVQNHCKKCYTKQELREMGK